ncbi:MAG: hypoxanthine phosphoribosyltransferase [bacterium]|nr:hypoxanthine phosphoribosyltransferase [bacterium]
MTDKDLDIIFDASSLDTRIAEMAAEISSDYDGKNILAVCVLRGAFIFAADLLRKITADVTLDYLEVTRYGNSDKPEENLKLISDLSHSAEGRHILVIEDIIDEGITLSAVRSLLLKRNPASIRICALFDKPEHRRADISGDYIGFRVPDRFVIGFGMDYKQRYRNIPYLAAVKAQ